MRTPLLPTLAAAAVLASAGAALACSCMPYRSAAEHLAAADMAFKGTVKGTRSTPEGRAVTTFRVTEVLKGPRVKTVSVRHQISSAACGVEYKTGKTVWVFASRGPDGGWGTSLCAAGRFDEAEYRRAARGESVPTQPRTM